MGKFILDNAFVSINGADLSDHVKSVTINYEGEVKDMTAMGATGRGKAIGLLNGSIDLELFQDFAALKVDATLWPLHGAAAFPVVIRPDAGVVAATNPQWAGNCVLAKYNPITGSVGDEAMAPVTLEVDGILLRTII